MRALFGFPLVFASSLVLLVVAAPSAAQSSYDRFGSARSAALGTVTTVLSGDDGGHVNPALRALHDRGTASFFVRQSFGLSDLRFGAAHVSQPFGWGTVTTGASTFGSDVYREVYLDAAIARGWSPGTSRRVYTGLGVRYAHVSVDGYGRAGAVGLHAGLFVHLVSSLALGVQATNVNGPEWADDVPMPQVLAVGVAYDAAPWLDVVAETSKDLDHPLSIRGGAEVQPVSSLTLRAGSASHPVRFTAGAGVTLGALDADVAAEQHQDLGWSPSASLRLRW